MVSAKQLYNFKHTSRYEFLAAYREIFCLEQRAHQKPLPELLSLQKGYSSCKLRL